MDGLLGFNVAFSFLQFESEAVFSVFVVVFAVLGFAVAACKGLDCEYSVFPFFVWLGIFLSAAWTLSHVIHVFCFVCLSLKAFYSGFENFETCRIC
jgi:hypothetical protein